MDTRSSIKEQKDRLVVKGRVQYKRLIQAEEGTKDRGRMERLSFRGGDELEDDWPSIENTQEGKGHIKL